MCFDDHSLVNAVIPESRCVPPLRHSRIERSETSGIQRFYSLDWIPTFLRKAGMTAWYEQAGWNDGVA
jgi:hypothetical protein